MRNKRPRRASKITSSPRIEFSTSFNLTKNPNYYVNIRVKDCSQKQAKSLWEKLQEFASEELKQFNK
jgi:hypothetical protein